MRTLVPAALAALVIAACGGDSTDHAKSTDAAARKAASARKAATLARRAPTLRRRARSILAPTGYDFIKGYSFEYDDIMGRTMHVKTDLFPKPENEHYAVGVCTYLTGGTGHFTGIDYITVDASEGSPLDSCG